jgi:hypothetical protein
VNKQHGNTVRVAGFVDIDLVRWFDRQLVALIRFYLGVKRLHFLALFDRASKRTPVLFSVNRRVVHDRPRHP